MITDDDALVGDAGLFWAALQLAGGVSEPAAVARLRRFTHTEMMAGRIDGETQDTIGRLLDTVAQAARSRVGQIIDSGAGGIAWDVLELVDSEGVRWRRAFGADRYVRNDDGALDDLVVCDWITASGWSTTPGLLTYAPLEVTCVARQPGAIDPPGTPAGAGERARAAAEQLPPVGRWLGATDRSPHGDPQPASGPAGTTGVTAGAVELGALALRLGLEDRGSLHVDGKTAESVTDHTVMVGLVACSWAARHQPDLNVGLIAEYAFIHDLVEAYAGDTQTLQLPTAAARADKTRRELEAFQRITAEIGGVLPWAVDRISEYEALSTREARWVKAVDKAAVKITHILNGGAAPRRAGMTVAELRARYDAQYEEVFGPGGYGSDFPTLALIYRHLVGRELSVLAAASGAEDG